MAGFIQQVWMTIAIVTTIFNSLTCQNVPTIEKFHDKKTEELLSGFIRHAIPVVYGRHFELIEVMFLVDMSRKIGFITAEIGLGPIMGTSADEPHDSLRCSVQVEILGMLFKTRTRTRANCTTAMYKIDNETNMISFDFSIVPLDSNEANIVTRYLRRNFSGAHLIQLSRNLEKNQTDSKCNVDKNFITYDVFYYYFDRSENQIYVCETDVKVDKRRKYEIEADFDSMENDNAGDNNNDLNNRCRCLEPNDLMKLF